MASGLVGATKDLTSSPYYRDYGEATPLLPRSEYGLDRLGIDNRRVWCALIIVVLFIGKFVQPFVNDIGHVVQTSLMDDPVLNVNSATLGGLFAAQDFVQGTSKLLVAFTIRGLRPRNAWLVVLAGGVITMTVVSVARSTPALFACTAIQALLYAFIVPATTMTIAAWIDGHLLGRAIGVCSVATKLSSPIMSEVYRHLLVDAVPDSWSRCYALAAAIFGGVLILFFVVMRSSAASVAFRPPTPPGARNGEKGGPDHKSGAEHKGGTKSGMDEAREPPLAREPNSRRAIYYILCMRRTWALLAAFVALCMCKTSTKFASLYARNELDLAGSSEPATLVTTNALFGMRPPNARTIVGPC
jgi:sugar phosphate permease